MKKQSSKNNRNNRNKCQCKTKLSLRDRFFKSSKNSLNNKFRAILTIKAISKLQNSKINLLKRNLEYFKLRDRKALAFKKL